MCIKVGGTMKFVKVDLLPTTKEHRCHDCDDQWGTFFAVDHGICVDPLCFACIMKYLDSINAVIG
jgi:hypothetical protein